MYFFAQAMQVEIITDVFLVDFHKELVAFEVTKPTDPAVARLTVIVVV